MDRPNVAASEELNRHRVLLPSWIERTGDSFAVPG